MADTSLLGLARASGSSSFTEFVAAAAPELLPGHRSSGPGGAELDGLIHGTTIIAATYADGVVLAGDRRATAGNLIAQREIEKVYAADDHSLIGIAGTAGIGVEMMRLFRVELEHYEKIEGTPLTLSGKANRLAGMVRGNLGAAMQGLVAIPLFAGYDIDATDPADAARIYSFDPVGSISAERYYHSIGSGSVFAKGSLKKQWRPGMTEAEITRAVVAALYDAADDDTATGGPDRQRRIFPIVLTATAEGTDRVSDEVVGRLAEEIFTERSEHPGS